jgi:predicted DNA-binding ribbon-helix-helix protein
MRIFLVDRDMSDIEKTTGCAGSIVGASHSGSAQGNPEALASRPAFPRRPRNQHDRARSSLAMHNIVVDGHRTAVRLEPVIWDALRDIAHRQAVTVHSLVSAIAKRRTASSLSSEIRAYVVVQLFAGLREAPSTRLFQEHQIGPRLMTGGASYPARSGK